MPATYVLATAAVKIAYDAYVTATDAVTTANAAIVAAGAIPAYPTVVVADADWNNVTTSRVTWSTNNDTLRATLNTAKASQRINEVAVLTALGYLSGVVGVDGVTGICLDQWVKVVGAGVGILTYTDYIGAGIASLYLTIVHTTAPAHPYPNTSLT